MAGFQRVVVHGLCAEGVISRHQVEVFVVLGCVDEIVVFSPLSEDTLVKISALMLDELKDSLKEKLIDFNYKQDLCDYLANKCDGGKRGARELRNLIRREIENKIVDIIVDNAEGSIASITASAKEEIKLKTELAK